MLIWACPQPCTLSVGRIVVSFGTPLRLNRRRNSLQITGFVKRMTVTVSLVYVLAPWGVGVVTVGVFGVKKHKCLLFLGNVVTTIADNFVERRTLFPYLLFV